ncbi:MAG: YkvA family protein [Rikenellaceae bacterium]|nr:YkvA family protein [Rikenellaceae bacterium]
MNKSDEAINDFKSGKWTGKAQSFVGNKQKMRSLLDSITGYLNKSALRPVFDKLRLMVSYLNDVYRGYYTDYSIKHYVIVIAAIIYVVSPMDAIPDLLPVVGLTDDATVIGAVFLSLKDELSRYSKWRNSLRHVNE